MRKSKLQIIQDAIKALEEHDWCRGALFRDERGHAMGTFSLNASPERVKACCAHGALYLGSPDILYGDSNIGRVICELDSLVDTHSIIDYNDLRAKDKEDILRVFRMAEANFKEQEDKYGKKHAD